MVPDAVAGGAQTEEPEQRVYGEPVVGVKVHCWMVPFHCRPLACGWILADGRHLDGRFRAVAPSVFRTELFIADTAGVITDSLPLPLADSTPSTTVRQVAPFGKRLIFAPTRDGLIWFGFSSDYSLSAMTLRGDTTLRIVGFADPVPTSAADRALFSEREEDFARAAGVPRRDTAQFPAAKPPVSQIFADEEGSLWVALASPIDGIVEWFDVYNPDGTIRARAHLRFPGSILPQGAAVMNPPPILVTREFIYMLTRDENDVPSVVRGRIKR
jgi:hypothetical protein